MAYSSPALLGTVSRPLCQVCCSSHKPKSSPSITTCIVPPKRFPSSTKETFPARADCLESEKVVESPTSPIAIASRAVSNTFCSLTIMRTTSSDPAEPLSSTAPLELGKLCSPGSDFGFQSGNSASTDFLTFLESSWGRTTVESEIAGSMAYRTTVWSRVLRCELPQRHE
ncbi:uncharacterized protein METZ01_LOCUS42734 [marine metagenome]|uniref:Uncharacterized protein n=1 Tax=marine metagenome TaxID=408172 RepID=A0A381RDX5_9ZZZZ